MLVIGAKDSQSWRMPSLVSSRSTLEASADVSLQPVSSGTNSTILGVEVPKSTILGVGPCWLKDSGS